MKIAIIGGGMAGLTAGWALSARHQVVLFEKAPCLGGYSTSVEVGDKGIPVALDTAFIAYNDFACPDFKRILEQLQVPGIPAEISFSVSDALSGLEYADTSLNTLFAQRHNLLSGRYWGMLRDMLRFGSEVETDLARDRLVQQMSLGEYLRTFEYSAAFREQYLMPVACALWSAWPEDLLEMPLAFFVCFLRNQGLLNLRKRPQWRVIRGGSRLCTEAMARSFSANIRLDCPVLQVKRAGLLTHQVEVNSAHGTEFFDQVVFACHGDEALAILAEGATPGEKELLSAIPFESRPLVLHTDSGLLPRNRRCWSGWNVSLNTRLDARPRLTWNMNILQNLRTEKTYLMTLDEVDDIREEEIIGMHRYAHPVLDQTGIRAQRRWAEINGTSGLWFCGAWWRNGFLEDAIWSALRVADAITRLRMPSERVDAA